MSPEQRLRRIVADAKGDDLERARSAFRGMSERQLDQQHGQSGRTRRQILQGYEEDRAEYDGARRLLDAMLKANVIGGHDLEMDRLRALVQPARDLVENIMERGIHDNWKGLAKALRDLEVLETKGGPPSWRVT